MEKRMKIKKIVYFLSLVIAVLIFSSASAFAVRCEVTNGKIKVWNITTDIPGEYGAVQIYDADKYNQAESFDDMLDAVIIHEQFTVPDTGWWNYSYTPDGLEVGKLYNVKVSVADETQDIGVLYRGKDKITYAQSVSSISCETIKFKPTTAKASYYYHFFDSKIKSGIHHINMDINIGDNINSFYMRLAGAADTNPWSDYNKFNGTFRFEKGGVFGVNSEIAEWNYSPQEFTYELNRDYHLDMWLDFDRRTISYYIDGEHFSTQKMWSNFNECHGIIFTATGEESDILVKNLEFTSYEFGKNQEFPGLVVPEYIEDTLDAWFETENPGHIFFDTNVAFDTHLLIRDNTQHEYEVKVLICDEEGNVLYSEEKDDLVIGAFEEKNISYEADMKKADKQYGKFILKAEFSDKSTGEKITRTVRFSTARASKVLNSKIGMHTQFAHGYGDENANMSLLKNGGFGVIRDFVDWATFNEANSWTLPQRYTRWEGIARENGQKQIITLCSNDTMLEGESFPNNDSLRAGFAEYAYNLVSQLKGRVDTFEIWNEPSYKVTAQEYAELVIATAPMIRKANSDAKIATMVVADLFPHTRQWVIDVLTYIENKGLDVRDYMDIIAIHPYRSYNAAPEKKEGVLQQNPYYYDGTPSVTDGTDALKKALSDKGYGDLPLIATEAGWFSASEPTGRFDGGKCEFDDTLTELEQAQYVVRLSALLHNDLDYITFHTLNNKMRTVKYEEFMGFTDTWKGVEIPCEAKPAFIAMANFNALLGNSSCVEENVSGKVYNYKFKKPDGKMMNMMWTTEGENTVSYTATGDGVWVYDIFGNREYIAGKSLKINVSESPVYVEGAGLEIFDESGNALNAVTDGKALVKGIAGDINCDYMLTVASYKDGRLIDVSITKSKGGNMSTSYIKTTDADEVRAFLWTESGVPVSDIIKITR